MMFQVLELPEGKKEITVSIRFSNLIIFFHKSIVGANFKNWKTLHC